MNQIGLIDRDDTVFVMIDIQEKFVPAISNMEQVIANANILLKMARILSIPLLVTEQYPKGLGHTTEQLSLPHALRDQIIEKLCFSCFDSDEFVAQLDDLERNTLVLFGIETHVCILKTALHGLKKGFDVHVVADATSSRELKNKTLALDRMRQSGVFIASTEMILFQLQKVAGTDEFKRLNELIT